MIFITKGAEPPSLAERREAGITDWSDIPGNVKDDIRRACRTEQAELCAFCCAKLPSEPLLQRIAHVEPRTVAPNRTLDFTNMVLSCSSGRHRYPDAAVAKGEQSCDESQGSEPLPVHPLQPDCQSMFDYLDNGAIQPAGTEAIPSIRILNLDCERLRRCRKAAISAALEMRARMDLHSWEKIYRDPPHPNIPEFWPAIAAQP